MSHSKNSVMELEFSKKYTSAKSLRYFEKHHSSLRRKVTTWREVAIAKKALKIAGNPKSVLDLPCGAGRFWKMLAQPPRTWLLAADLSEHMLEVAESYQAPEIVERFQLFQSSAFDIQMVDNSVDNIFCMRLMHHIVESEDRLKILREFYRVTSDTVCLSMWVDGNVQASNRHKLEQQRGSDRFVNRIFIPEALAKSEYVQAGFEIVDYIDLCPKISMWRIYILRKQTITNPNAQ